MINVYKNRAKEAKKELKKSYGWKFASFAVLVIVTAVLTYVGASVLTSTIAEKGAYAASETAEKWSEQNWQRGKKIWDENNQEWKREVCWEKVNDNSIKITSSEDGEAVDIVA